MARINLQEFSDEWPYMLLALIFTILVFGIFIGLNLAIWKYILYG